MLFLGFDFGGTKLACGVVSVPDGTVVAISTETTPGSGAPSSIEVAFRLARTCIERSGLSVGQIAGAGISFGGPVDLLCEKVLLSHHESGWEDVPLRQMVEEEFGLRSAMENDANAAALGEWRFGAGRGHSLVAYLTISSGIGGGLVQDGTIYRGFHGAAGEIGHTIVLPDGPLCTCGRKGCLESLASGWSIGRRGREALETGLDHELGMESSLRATASVDSAEVFNAAAAGDRLAERIVLETCKYLAIGIGNLINLFDPEIVVLGGGVANAGDLLLSPLGRGIRTEAIPVSGVIPPIVAGQLGNRGGLMGAIAAIAQRLGA